MMTNISKQIDVRRLQIEDLEQRLHLSCTHRSTEPGTLSGQIFEDANRNGVQEVNELGLDGFRIKIVQIGRASHCDFRTSPIDLDSDNEIDPSFEQGRFEVSEIPAGRYRLFQHPTQFGWKITSNHREFEISSDQTTELPAIGTAMFEPAVIEVRGFVDHNKNGEKDNSESWLDRISVRLSGDEVSTPVTSVSETKDRNGDGTIDVESETGLYTQRVTPGEYEISASPTSKLFDQRLTKSITLSEGAIVQVAFGFAPPQFGSVSGQVFNDVNENGTRDADEFGLAGWQVRIDGRLTYSAVSQDIDLNDDGIIDPMTESGIYRINGVLETAQSYDIFIHGQPGWITVSPLGQQAKLEVAANETTMVGIAMLRPLPGDFHRDGMIDAQDIDLLCQQIRHRYEFLYDLNGDYRMSLADRDYLIENILHTSVGDANLDGRFDSSDLVQISQAGEYEDEVRNNSTWIEGDWNCDAEFNALDLIFAFREGDYQSAAVAAAIEADITKREKLTIDYPRVMCRSKTE